MACWGIRKCTSVAELQPELRSILAALLREFAEPFQLRCIIQNQIAGFLGEVWRALNFADDGDSDTAFNPSLIQPDLFA